MEEEMKRLTEHNGKRVFFGILLIVTGVIGWFMGKSDAVSTVVIAMGGTLLQLGSKRRLEE
jgi:predicted negative regulator of RcsB-dependent stress response